MTGGSARQRERRRRRRTAAHRRSGGFPALGRPVSSGSRAGSERRARGVRFRCRSRGLVGDEARRRAAADGGSASTVRAHGSGRERGPSGSMRGSPRRGAPGVLRGGKAATERRRCGRITADGGGSEVAALRLLGLGFVGGGRGSGGGAINRAERSWRARKARRSGSSGGEGGGGCGALSAGKTELTAGPTRQREEAGARLRELGRAGGLVRVRRERGRRAGPRALREKMGRCWAEREKEGKRRKKGLGWIKSKRGLNWFEFGPNFVKHFEIKF